MELRITSYNVCYTKLLRYQKLIKIRKENQVLNNGSLHFTIAKGQLLAYERMAGNDLIIVLFNNSDQTQKLPFQTGKYINLLTRITSYNVCYTKLLRMLFVF